MGPTSTKVYSSDKYPYATGGYIVPLQCEGGLSPRLVTMIWKPSPFLERTLFVEHCWFLQLCS